MTAFILLIVFTLLLGAGFWIRLNLYHIRKQLYRMKIKGQTATLRKAIRQADRNKAENDRKNMVIWNNVTEQFEPVEKKLLKNITNRTKRVNNAAATKYRKRNPQGGKRLLEAGRPNKVEKQSLYVTR